MNMWLCWARGSGTWWLTLTSIIHWKRFKLFPFDLIISTVKVLRPFPSTRCGSSISTNVVSRIPLFWVSHTSHEFFSYVVYTTPLSNCFVRPVFFLKISFLKIFNFVIWRSLRLSLIPIHHDDRNRDNNVYIII